MIRTSIESARGCGYRKPGGLYLVGPRLTEPCPLLPWALDVCPTCGQGIKPARGWTWVEPPKLFPARRHGTMEHNARCPLGWQEADGASLTDTSYHRTGPRAGLIWVGEKFYSMPHDFLGEAAQMGVSRRIKAVPRGFELGMWVYLGHRKAITKAWPISAEPLSYSEVVDILTSTPEHTPGVITLFKPAAIEYIVKGDESDEQIEALEERGIECVKVVQATEQMEVFA